MSLRCTLEDAQLSHQSSIEGHAVEAPHRGNSLSYELYSTVYIKFSLFKYEYSKRRQQNNHEAKKIGLCTVAKLIGKMQ